MHQRYLDRIRTDHDRAGEEEDRRIAVGDEISPVHRWLLMGRTSKNRCLIHWMGWGFMAGCSSYRANEMSRKPSSSNRLQVMAKRRTIANIWVSKASGTIVISGWICKIVRRVVKWGFARSKCSNTEAELSVTGIQLGRPKPMGSDVP